MAITTRTSAQVQVFEPNAHNLPRVGDYVADVLARREFISELAHAEVKGLRSKTILGELWTIVDPLFQAMTYMFLFLVIRGSSGRSADYVTAIIGSIFLFNFTRISISDGGRAILRSRGLVLNAIFPRALLPIAEVYKGLISTVPALILYAILHLAIGAPVTAALLLLPVLFALHSVLNLGFALLFSTATVILKDVANLINYVLRVLMFSTPVIYPVSLLNDDLYRVMLSINPLFALFSAYQAVITGTTPSAGVIIQATLWALVMIGFGAWIFLRHERSFGLHV